MTELLQTTFLSSEWESDDLVLFSYLMNHVVDSKIDPGAFKKMVSPQKQKQDNTFGLELRNLWVARMWDNKDQFRKAAMSWADINNGTSEGINPFWDGINPPSIISLPHIATQALLEQIFLLGSILIEVLMVDLG
jgi:hypothetical protein